MKTKLEYRMYGLVPYNLSPIQQGIQFGHAVQEFNNMIIDDFMFPGGNCPPELVETARAFSKWRKEDKTFIILNGGTTNSRTKGFTSEFVGTLNEHMFTLHNHDVSIATFFEPDLGDQLTAVVFLVDERVFNKEKYPDRFLGGGPEPNEDGMAQAVYFAPESEEDYEKRLGGKKNVWLREFLKQFRLA